MTFEKLSEKQKRVFRWAFTTDYKAIICDGAVRSGKTICMITAFILWAMREFNGATFGICGKTVASAERNMIDPLRSITDITAYFKIRYTTSNQHILTVENRQSCNRFYVFGGKDESSYELLQGITLSGIFLDEVALMPESFVNQAVARTLSVKKARYWFNCNPEGPTHWFYRNWILKAEEQNALHLHFLMSDNPTLDKEQLREAETRFSGVFYDRYIRGLWVVADGVIYSMFDASQNVLPDVPFRPERELIAVDYGTYNPCVFLHMYAAGTGDGMKHYIDREYYHSGRDESAGVAVQKDDEQYARDMLTFTGGRKDIPIIVDPSASSFITRLRHDGFTQVIPANNAVAKGIAACAVELTQRRLTVSPECRHTLVELPSYVWDVKHAQRTGEDRPLKINDHCCDALRYGVYFDILANPSVRPSVSGRGARG